MLTGIRKRASCISQIHLSSWMPQDVTSFVIRETSTEGNKPK